MKLLTIATSILFVGLFVATLLLVNIIPIWATLSLFCLYNFVAGILYSMMIDEPYRTPSPEQKPLIIPEKVANRATLHESDSDDDTIDIDSIEEDCSEYYPPIAEL
jgi:hypothetical protein